MNPFVISDWVMSHLFAGQSYFMASKVKVCGIYKITNPAGLIYIGQSIDLIRRMKRYSWFDCKNNSRLYESFLQFGYESHEIKIIKKCKPCELDKWEQFYIKKHKSLDPRFGFNSTSGGRVGFIPSDEVRKKYSENTKGEKNPNYGKKHSLAVRKIISKANKGRKMSESAKRKLSIFHKGRTLGSEHPKSKPVAQFDRSGYLINILGSLKEAADSVNGLTGGISAACKNIRPTYRNHIWMYL